MDTNVTFVADPEVVVSEVDGGAALLDLRSSQYYGLNPVGAFVWSQLQTAKTMDALVDAVAGAFDVQPADCRDDIERLLKQFEEAGVARRDA
jgi:hypothetical protein